MSEADGSPPPLVEALEAYARARMPEAEGVRVASLSRIPGGASRETYRFTLAYQAREGAVQERKLILRRDPPSSMLESERRIEFEAYRAFHGSAVPVPEMLWLEEDTRHLGQPFFVAEEIAGYQSDPFLLASEAYSGRARTIARNKWSILGEIAKADPERIGYTRFLDPPPPAEAWRIALDYWAGVIDEDSVRAEPIMQGVIRWLRRHPPPAAQKISVVHGDFRTGNFLYDEEGAIHGVLDWEMTHLGDPLEDLAWSLNRAWCFGKDERRGGLAPRQDAIAIWEAASGLNADPDALHWWELFSCVKGQALWISAARNWIDSPKREVINAVSAWLLLNSQDRAALELMGKL